MLNLTSFGKLGRPRFQRQIDWTANWLFNANADSSNGFYA